MTRPHRLSPDTAEGPEAFPYTRDSCRVPPPLPNGVESALSAPGPGLAECRGSFDHGRS